MIEELKASAVSVDEFKAKWEDDRTGLQRQHNKEVARLRGAHLKEVEKLKTAMAEQKADVEHKFGNSLQTTQTE